MSDANSPQEQPTVVATEQPEMQVPEKAARIVRRAEHIFDPPDYLPVVITKNRARPFRFSRNFRYRIVLNSKTILDIEIPEGFECDLGSFPWFARWLPGFTQAGPHNRALAIHDFLYRTQPFDKITCDFITREVLIIDGVGWWMRFEIIGAVVVGGRKAWNDNKAELEKEVAAANAAAKE